VEILSAQSPRQRAVELTASVQENPAQITLNWVIDFTSPGYTIYRKGLQDTTWGNPYAVLPGWQTEFVDDQVDIGQEYEYAFYKEEFSLIFDTLEVPAATPIHFSLASLFGQGLCCSFGFGSYELSDCGEVLAKGADFGMMTAHQFTTCGNPGETVELYLKIVPDILPHATSWILSEDRPDTLIQLHSSTDKGPLLAPRPNFGYINTGIRVAQQHQNRHLLILIEDQFRDPLAAELEQLQLDLIGDGYTPIIREANRDEAPMAVRSRIQQLKSEVPTLEAVLILGHVPVPYSGDLHPDGHLNHKGAWTADVFYGELDGVWTDTSVTSTGAFLEVNHNVPGDGKFDQTGIPTGKVELQVGRVDFHIMTYFGDELELLRDYLKKNHEYKQAIFKPIPKAIIDDNLNQALAAPSAAAWRNFTPMFGPDGIKEGDYFTELRDSAFQWAFGSGSGSHISAFGVGSSEDFSNDSLLNTFTMMVGSQFGDWDNWNNFLRAPLAQGRTLTNCWSGNPVWTLHHMAFGKSIGYATLATQNSNNGVYIPGPQIVHVALMGDPTLRMHYFESVPELNLTYLTTKARLNWSPSPAEGVEGYYIYRTDDLSNPFKQVKYTTDTTWVDPYPFELTYYMVRAARMEQTFSGSYENLSLGIIERVNNKQKLTGILDSVTNPVFPIIAPNPSGLQSVLQLPEGKTFTQASFMDLSGKVVRQLSIPPGTRNVPIEAPSGYSGVLFIQLESTQGNEVLKWIVW